MRCRDLEKDISAYLDGELSTPLSKRVSAHLAECAECRASTANLSALSGKLKSMEEIDPSPDFSIRLRNRIEAEWASHGQGLSWMPRLLPFPVLSAVALILGIALGGYLVDSHTADRHSVDLVSSRLTVQLEGFGESSDDSLDFHAQRILDEVSK